MVVPLSLTHAHKGSIDNHHTRLHLHDQDEILNYEKIYLETVDNSLASKT